MHNFFLNFAVPSQKSYVSSAGFLEVMRQEAGSLSAKDELGHLSWFFYAVKREKRAFSLSFHEFALPLWLNARILKSPSPFCAAI